jgi:surfactin synthase thioesterase subunit
VRLVLLPFAGGSSYSYRGLISRLPGWIEPTTPELPGRGTRFREPLATQMEALAENLLERLRLQLQAAPRWSVFGHSMGALLAYELARRARDNRLPEPGCLIASGRRPPQLSGNERLHDLPRPQLLVRLHQLGGLPPEAEQHPELMDLMLPILRADLCADEGYRFGDWPPLGCAITVLRGSGDDVTPEAAARWGDLTTGPCKVEDLPGGHFFIQESPAATAAAVVRALEPPPLRFSG